MAHSLWYWHSCFFPFWKCPHSHFNVFLSTFRWLQYNGEMESWHSLLPHTHTHTYAYSHPNSPKDAGRLSNKTRPNKKIKFKFSILRRFGMFWPFEFEHDSNAVCNRAKYLWLNSLNLTFYMYIKDTVKTEIRLEMQSSIFFVFFSTPYIFPFFLLFIPFLTPLLFPFPSQLYYSYICSICIHFLGLGFVLSQRAPTEISFIQSKKELVIKAFHTSF